MLKITIIFVSLLLCLPGLARAGAEEDKLLESALTFSKTVKEFGKTIGIQPSEVLTKTTKDIPPKSKIIIYMQKRGTIAKRTDVDENLYLHIGKQVSDVPVIFSNLGTKVYSAYYRQVNESAAEDMPITADFARASRTRQAELILHEDLHMNTTGLWFTENVESIVTPLAYLSALNYFKKNNDGANEKETLYIIDYLRNISVEINELTDIAENIYRTEKDYGDAQVKIIERLDEKTEYSKRFWKSVKGQAAYDAFEALLSMDLLYLKYFERIVSLYYINENISLLIEDMKRAPGKTAELEKYFDTLEAKYSNPAL